MFACGSVDTPLSKVRSDIFPHSPKGNQWNGLGIKSMAPKYKRNISAGRRDSVYIQMEKIPEGQVYVPRLEPTAPICLADRNYVHYPSHHCTIFKKRWLSNGLPARMIQCAQEWSEDVTRTLDAPPSKMRSDISPHSLKGNQSDGWELLPPRRSNKIFINRRKKGVRIN